jgi:hypothetical protein
MKLLRKNKSQYSIVTYVKEIKVEPLYEDDQTLQRNIHIVTKYGETLDLVLYADERQQLDVLVPPEVYKGELDEEDEYLS